MPDPIVLTKAFAAAAVMALALALALRRIGSAGGALAIGSAWFVGIWVLGLLPNFPPREDRDRLLFVLLPAVVLAELLAAVHTRAGWAARFGVALAAVPVLLHGSSYVTDLTGPGTREWSLAQSLVIFAVSATILLTNWFLMNRLAKRSAGGSPLWSVATAVMGAAVVVMLSGYASGGQLGVPLGAALGGFALASLLRRDQPGVEGAMGVGVSGLFALLIVGRFFAGLTQLNGVLLMLAPLLAWLPEALPLGPRGRGGLRVGLTAIPVLVALVLAQHRFAVDSAPSSAGSTDASVQDYMNFGK